MEASDFLIMIGGDTLLGAWRELGMAYIDHGCGTPSLDGTCCRFGVVIIAGGKDSREYITDSWILDRSGRWPMVMIQERSKNRSWSLVVIYPHVACSGGAEQIDEKEAWRFALYERTFRIRRKHTIPFGGVKRPQN